MAELVDALRSGRSGRKAVEVRVLFWAPLLQHSCSRIIEIDNKMSNPDAWETVSPAIPPKTLC